MILLADLQEQHGLRHSVQAPAFVDLQVHTTASDGLLTPSAVVQAAHEAQLLAIAITDHDTISGLDEAAEAGVALGVRIIRGVELSTHFDGEEVHLLGLHIRHGDAIRIALHALQAQRVSRAESMVGRLNELGILVTLDEVLGLAGEGSVGRPHVARAMVAGGWVREFREAFDKWIGFGCPAYIPREPFTLADAVDLVHRAGGLAVWAHPGPLATAAYTKRLAMLGLDGVEVLHPSHPPELAQRILDVVEQLGLLPSGGSDWHGPASGPRSLGGQRVPAAWLGMQDAHMTQ